MPCIDSEHEVTRKINFTKKLLDDVIENKFIGNFESELDSD